MLRLIKSDYLKLVPIVVLAFYFAFIPHQDYPYPVHVDEWVQMAYSQAILEAGDTAFVNPFYGGGVWRVSPVPSPGLLITWR